MSAKTLQTPSIHPEETISSHEIVEITSKERKAILERKTGYCYIINFKGGICKIGSTRDYKKRITELSTRGLVVVCTFVTERCKNYKAIEQTLLKTFSEKQVNGEYFKVKFKHVLVELNSLGLTQHTDDELLSIHKKDNEFIEKTRNLAFFRRIDVKSNDFIGEVTTENPPFSPTQQADLESAPSSLPDDMMLVNANELQALLDMVSLADERYQEIFLLEEAMNIADQAVVEATRALASFRARTGDAINMAAVLSTSCKRRIH